VNICAFVGVLIK